MNWTGGSLQRHSKNAHNSVVNRQKEHFARIRIGLQNGANAATVPFRPSYLEEDNDTLCSQLSPFGRRSVRHVGHSKRTLKGRGSEASCRWEMESRYPRGNTKHLTEMLASRGRHHAKTQHRTSSSDVAASTTGNAHGTPKDAVQMTDITTEHQLLEANRLRLLQQRDWAGLEAQSPAKMQFPSMREKDRIGKRRKIRKQRGQQAKIEETITWPSRYQTHDKHPGPYMSRGLRDDIRDIKIRVGTGALRTETSHSDYAKAQQAEASREELSDPMLFDHEETYPSPKGSRQEPRSVSNHQTVSGGSVMKPTLKGNEEFSLSEHHRLHETLKQHIFPHDKAGSHQNQPGEPGVTNHNPMLLDSVNHVLATARPQPEEPNSNALLIGRGRYKSLRLIVDPSSENASSMGAIGDTAAVGDGDVEEGVACRQANAGFSDFGHQERRDSGERGFSRRTSGRLPSIVDDKRWKAFVDITETSSSRSTALLSHTPHRSPKVNGPEDVHCAWSQQATVGGQTLAQVSSPISASLRSIEHSNGGGTAGDASYVDNKRAQIASRHQSHGIDESERLWRTFVFADEDLASEGHAMHDRCIDARSRSSVATKERAGLLPPDCTGAVSMDSKLLPTVPESAPAGSLRMTDKGRDAANVVQFRHAQR